MGSKYPILTPKEVTGALERFGFRFVSQRGSHMKYSNGTKSVIVPNHTEVARGDAQKYTQHGRYCAG